MATMENATKFNVSVPLGDKDHPGEEKGSTKVVRRVLSAMKGSSPKRTAVVFWRKEYYSVAESTENPGHFDVTGKAKKSDVPEQATAAKPGVRKVQVKGSSRKASPKAATKESDRRSRRAA